MLALLLLNFCYSFKLKINPGKFYLNVGQINVFIKHTLSETLVAVDRPLASHLMEGGFPKS